MHFCFQPPKIDDAMEVQLIKEKLFGKEEKGEISFSLIPVDIIAIDEGCSIISYKTVLLY